MKINDSPTNLEQTNTYFIIHIWHNTFGIRILLVLTKIIVSHYYSWLATAI
jgi:hypothetical protein